VPEVVDDFCFDSLRRSLAAVSSRVEQTDGGLGNDCPIPPRGEARRRAISRGETAAASWMQKLAARGPRT
jgi:hypothetical protein